MRSSTLTVGRYLEFLGASERLVEWPPDVFAVAVSLLQKSQRVYACGFRLVAADGQGQCSPATNAGAAMGRSNENDRNCVAQRRHEGHARRTQ
jgi:hypothetical protein